MLPKNLPLLAVLLAVSSISPAVAQPLAPAASSAAAGQDTSDAPAVPTEAENPYAKLVNSLDWKMEGSADVGSMAAIKVPEGYRYTGSNGTIKLMEMYGNLTSGNELGYISPLDMGWFAVFEFEKIGYVKEDEKDDLDADKILEQLREGQQHANSELSSRGMPTLIITGWQKPPFYNPETKNLEWAIRLRSSDGGEVVNYKTKILGRRGVMDVVLVCDEKELDTVVPEYQKLLTGFAFKKSDAYASFEKGDEVAKYGLTGLIVGGGLLAAAKTGLLGKLGIIIAKMGKLIIIPIVAVGAFIKRIFTGKKRETI